MPDCGCVPKIAPPAEPTHIPLGSTTCSLAVVKHCRPHRPHIRSRTCLDPPVSGCSWTRAQSQPVAITWKRLRVLLTPSWMSFRDGDFTGTA